MTDNWYPVTRDDEVVVRDHLVTAVLVAHDGARWLTACLATLAELERLPDVLVAVDTGSTDETSELLRVALGAEYVVNAAVDEGFGGAIARGLERAAALAPAITASNDRLVRWVWLLHDDCAPAPDALTALLGTSDRFPDAMVIGPKVRGWHDRRLLIEVGVTVTGSGRRDTGLERAETDQGQHDGVRDVLAVGSAGMLVRRELWDQLDGFDPALPLFRDDVEFCWRAREAGARVIVSTSAVVHHAEAASRHRRHLVAVINRPQLVDRAHSLYTALVHAPAWAVPLLTIRHIVGTALRVMGFLLAKSPARAQDDLAALGLVLLRPDRIWVGRSRVRRTRSVSRRKVRAYLTPPGQTFRHALETLAGVITTSRGESSYVSALETGPTSDDADFLAPSGIRRVVRRPAIVLVLGLIALTLFAGRLSLGSGTPVGGALLHTPDSAATLWQAFLAAWHDVGPGSTVPSDPYLVVLALLSVVTLGHGAWVVAGLLWLGPALAGLAAYLALRGVVPSRWVRVWAGATYALLPSVVGAVVTGRLGTLVLAIALPAIVRVLVRATRSWRAAWSAGILLALVASFVPGVLVAAPLLIVALGSFLIRERGVWARLLCAGLVPIALCEPWSIWVLAHPAQLLFEAGVKLGPGLADPHLRSWHIALVHPGGAGMAPSWTTVGLLLGGVLAGLRPDTRHRVLGAWAVGVTALLLALVQSRLRLAPVGANSSVVAWPGPALLVLGACLIFAVVAVTTGLRTRMRLSSFGLSQPTTIAVLVLLLLAPASAAAWWAFHPRAIVQASSNSVLPQFVQVLSGPPDRPRTLLLGSDDRGHVDYSLLAGGGSQLGDAETAPPAWTTAALDSAVAGLVAGRVGTDVYTLATYGVRYVLVSNANDAELLARLDLAGGLRRVAASDGSALWVLNPSPPRAFVVGLPGSYAPMSWTNRITGSVPATTDQASCLLLLSAPSAGGWWANIDGHAMHGTQVAGWEQAFVVPTIGGQLTAGFGGGPRRTLLWLEFALLAIATTLALPGRRRESVETEADVFGSEPARIANEQDGHDALTAPVAVAPAGDHEDEVPTSGVDS